MDVLQQVCQRVRQRLCERKHIVIVDDVWPEDFDMFRRDRLAVGSLQSGSVWVLTSRDGGLAASGGRFEIVALLPADTASAQSILLQNARVCAVEEGPVTSELHVRILRSSPCLAREAACRLPRGVPFDHSACERHFGPTTAFCAERHKRRR